MVDHGPMATLVVDHSGTIEWASLNIAGIVGHDAADLIGIDVFTLLPETEAARARAAVEVMSEFHLRSRGMVYHLRTASGDYEPCLVTAHPHEVDGRKFVQVSVMAMPLRLVVGEALQSVLRGAALFESLAEIEQAVNRSLVGAWFAIAFTDPHSGERSVVGSMPPLLAGIGSDGRPDDRADLPWMPAMKERTSRVVEDLSELPDDVAAVAQEHGQASVVAVPVPHDSSDEPTLLIGWVPVPKASVAMLRGLEDAVAPVIALVLDRQHHLERVRWAAEHDQLTRLENRERFHGRVRTSLSTGRKPLAVLYVDIDHFKAINDRHGHGAGDAVLRAVADRLASAVPTAATCARLGGDEFAVALPSDSIDDAGTVADAIIEAITEPVEIPDAATRLGHDVSIVPSVSIGVAVGSPRTDAGHLIADADAALLRAKRTERGTWQL